MNFVEEGGVIFWEILSSEAKNSCGWSEIVSHHVCDAKNFLVPSGKPVIQGNVHFL